MDTRFAEYVKFILAERGWDVMELARRVGISRVTASRHLNARRLPHYSVRRLYAQSLGMTPDQFEEAWRARKLLHKGQWTITISDDTGEKLRVPQHVTNRIIETARKRGVHPMTVLDELLLKAEKVKRIKPSDIDRAALPPVDILDDDGSDLSSQAESGKGRRRGKPKGSGGRRGR